MNLNHAVGRSNGEQWLERVEGDGVDARMVASTGGFDCDKAVDVSKVVDVINVNFVVF